MAVSVTLSYLGFADNDAELTARIEQVFERYEGDWKVKIVGDQRNTMWSLTITNPEGNKVGLKHLYGEDGDHQVKKILDHIQNMMRDQKEKIPRV